MEQKENNSKKTLSFCVSVTLFVSGVSNCKNESKLTVRRAKTEQMENNFQYVSVLLSIRFEVTAIYRVMIQKDAFQSNYYP